MKMIILSIGLLCSVIFSSFSQNTNSAFCGSWEGDITSIEYLIPGLDVTGVAVPESRMWFSAETEDIRLTRRLCKSSSENTTWCSVLIHKGKGETRFGLSLDQGTQEKLFLGIKEPHKIVCGEEPLRIQIYDPAILFIRIDYSSDKEDKAYIFVNPSLASVPDIEGAEYVLSGDFVFDRISLLAEKGSVGDIGGVKIGKTFEEVVEQRKIGITSGKGQQQRIENWRKEENALWLQTTGGTLRIQPLASGSLHVQFGSADAIKNTKSYAVTELPVVACFEVEEQADQIVLKTEKIKATVDKQAGYISLFDATGKLLVQELPEGAKYNISESTVQTFCKYRLHDNEALYGLGQFRDNLLNLRNAERELIQFNTQAAVPVIYSTRGWGLFWDNPTRTIYKDDATGMSFLSDYGDIIDYYFFTGERLDDLVSAYRSLTGKAPMTPDWTLGFHQSRNKYATQSEVLEVARRMEQEKIPMSSIFIDYFYWEKYGTGSHRFDETLFPNANQMLDSLHRIYDTKAVITIWPTFQPGITNYEELAEKGFILEGAKALDGFIYDAFHPEAAKLYWKQVSKLVDYPIDGWFLDGPEPDHIVSFLPTTTYAGPAVKVRNLYPLVHATTFYNGLLQARPNQRPYILTRCAWASQQKTGTAIWSGDIPTTFEELACQVAAGLSFTATGIPYWTTDIGGYYGGDPADKEYQELFTRWFQYGTFCPVFRSHGRRYPGDRTTPNELWAYGAEAQRICSDFIELRYKLLPYIYSLSGMVTHQDYTPMRLLAFDFPEDTNVLDCKDQFMYGPAFLICPVLEAGAISRQVYLPAGQKWIDFRTGNEYTGGVTMVAEAPANHIPIYIRAGSIIPSYPTLQKHITTEIPLDVCVYKGADGYFELYEDDGETLDYQKSVYSIIPFTWNEKEQTLIIGDKKGKFGKKEREFIIRYKNANGSDLHKKVKYVGDKMKISLK